MCRVTRSIPTGNMHKLYQSVPTGFKRPCFGAGVAENLKFQFGSLSSKANWCEKLSIMQEEVPRP